MMSNIISISRIYLYQINFKLTATQSCTGNIFFDLN